MTRPPDSPFFSISATDGSARLGRIETPHGEIETPVFMPVGTLGSVKGVPQHILEELGVQILLGNTYHLYLRPGHESIREMGGLHRFMSWNRSILTDSGGFQVFSLNELRKVSEQGVEFRSHLDGSTHFFTPERSMEVQIALGADIIMTFDECTEHPAGRNRARESMEMTTRWAKRSKDYFEAHKDEVPWALEYVSGPSEARRLTSAAKAGSHNNSAPARLKPCPSLNQFAARTGRQSLFGIVQGGMHTDLRRESAERLLEWDFPGYAIGGLSVGEPRELTREIIASTLPLLPKDKPRYVMGVGYPEEIAEYAAMGVDMMDCVLPTRAARHGLLFTSEGRMNIKNARYARDQQAPDPNCRCIVCSRYTRAYLRHLFVSGEALAAVLNTIHNLAHYLDTMRSVRHAIKLGELRAKLSDAAQVSEQSS
ncbi:MAG TPA: tRNA guanosine(34) transglycosylase Tgt [Terriglobales bacterium]|nr:tRNA guanosine(34) transglycosylase Tgt [Terriglobales bacterium]